MIKSLISLITKSGQYNKCDHIKQWISHNSINVWLCNVDLVKGASEKRLDCNQFTSHSEYLVRNPIHSALWKCKRQKLKKYFDYLIQQNPYNRGFKKFFQLHSNSTPDKLMDGRLSCIDNICVGVYENA